MEAAFLPADLNFRVRPAFFAAKLRFVGMGLPLVQKSYGAALITLNFGAFKSSDCEVSLELDGPEANV
jgi:hypothetical protein